MGALTLDRRSPSPSASTDVIKGVDLEVADGEFCVFVGPSGCGKSTLLRIIAGLEDATSGDILIDGRRRQPDAAEPARDRHGVPDLRALPAPHRPRQHGPRPEAGRRRAPSARQRARRRRLAACCRSSRSSPAAPPSSPAASASASPSAAPSCARPKLFLFDEPLSNLDAALRVATRIEIARLHRELAGDDDLRHPRPGRGDDAGRPHRRAERRPHRAGRRADGALQQPRQHLRRRLHRLAADELPRSRTARRRPARPSASAPSTWRSAARPARIPGTISHVEHLGGETNVYVRTEAHGLVTVRRFGEHRYAVDETVHLTPDPARQFLFDAEGRRLTP